LEVSGGGQAVRVDVMSRTTAKIWRRSNGIFDENLPSPKDT